MPYGWDQSFPPQGNNQAFPPDLYQQQQQNGQQTQYSRQPVAGHQQQQQHHHNHQSHSGYSLPNTHTRTQYSTPYDQAPQSFYQSPSPPIQYQQQPYQSPPTPQNRFPPALQYSPDPLQNWQNPPHSHQHFPQQQQQQQQHRGYPQYRRQLEDSRPRPAQPPQNPRPEPVKQNLPASEWSKFPASPYASTQSNAASLARNSHLPPQQQHHPQRQPQSQPQRTPSQPRPPSSGQARPTLQGPNKLHGQSHQQHSQPPQPSHAPVTVNPQDVQRRVAHVQIPAQRTPQRPDENPMARSPKRRRSNEGHVVPVDSVPPQAIPQPSRVTGTHRPKVEPAASSPLTEVASSQIPTTPAPSSTIDNQAVLLGLSDEYISAAYSMSADLSFAEVDEEQLDHYHSLLATGMGCLDTVLKNYRITDARKEARIRLRFASLLYEETDNDLEAEECLSKGVSSCERSRLPDLKYAMHHVLARVWFKAGKTKAAMKAVEKLIVEVEKLNLIHWVYAFRFLRVSFGLQVEGNPGETAVMLKHLAAVAETAVSNHYTISVQIVASTLSAMIHLRSRSPDSVDAAQRDLAAARTHQLSPEMDLLPQVKALLDCLNLACSLIQVRPEQAQAKMQVMQGNLDTSSREPTWRNERHWSMPLGQAVSTSPDIEADSYGIFKLLPNGECALNFTWLNQTQIYATGFLLSGLSALHHNATNELRAEQSLYEGVKLSKQLLPFKPQSVVAASTQSEHQSSMLVTIRLYLVFAFCGRSAWDSGLNGIAAVRRDLSNWGMAPDESTSILLTYLEAMCKHGLGELDAALQLYRSPELALNLAPDVRPSPNVVNPIKILASLNSILVMRTSRVAVEAADRQLAQLEPYCVTHTNSNGSEYGNKAMEAAYNILKATSSSQTSADGMIIKTKQYLQSAVHGAKITLNNQLLCIVMNLMTKLFFSNIVGEQAEKSAKAGRSLAKKSKDKLWTAVADRMYADTLVRCGKSEEAQQVRAEGQQTMLQLPSAVRTAFQELDVKTNGLR